MPSEDGQGDLQALAADLDDDRLAARLLLGVGVGGGGEGLDLVDELGLDPAGVDRERVGWPVSSGAKAGSVTTARWKGMAVAMPSTWNSASARAARCRACSRVAPVTISLASRESQAGPMTRAGLHARVQADAGAGGRGEGGDGAGGGQEAAARVLAVDAELEGVAAQRRGRRSRAPRRRRCGTSRGPGRCR